MPTQRKTKSLSLSLISPCVTLTASYHTCKISLHVYVVQYLFFNTQLHLNNHGEQAEVLAVPTGVGLGHRGPGRVAAGGGGRPDQR